MPKPAESYVTVTEAAGLFGKSSRWIQSLVQAGQIEKPSRGAYSLGALCRGVTAHYEARLADGTKTAAAQRATEARTREIELRIAERTRDLIPQEDAKAAISQLAATVKAEFTGLPARMTRDMAERRRLEQECDESLTRIADALERAGVALAARGDNPEAESEAGP